MSTKIFCDIAELDQITKFNKKNIVKGFTTNPSLMRKAGAKDYKSYSKKILKICNNKPVSLEVFADEYSEMKIQAIKINTWGKNVFVKVNNQDNSYFKDNKKEVYKFHIAHNEGNYFCSNDQIKDINDNNQIAMFYSDENGNVNEQSNPNGSLQNIAGIFNKQKNVLGMMPHPERMIDPALSGEDGSLFFENLINNLR